MDVTLEAGLRAARALDDVGNDRAAAALLRRLLGEHPDDTAAHYLLGLSLFKTGDRAGALAACRAAVALDPADAMAHRMLGIVLGGTREARRQGLEHLRQAVTLSPQDGFSHYVLARALADLGRRREARHSFADACDRAPSEPVVLSGAAAFLFTIRSFTEARDLAARAMALAPEHHQALTTQARGFLLMGRAAEARDLARAAVAREASYRPAIEVLIEAEMCRNPLFALWSRLKGWCHGSRWRTLALVIGGAEGMAALIVGVTTTLFPHADAISVVVFWAGLALAWLPSWLHRRRVTAALRPVKLRKRF